MYQREQRLQELMLEGVNQQEQAAKALRRQRSLEKTVSAEDDDIDNENANGNNDLSLPPPPPPEDDEEDETGQW